MAKLLLSCDDTIFLHEGNYYTSSSDKLEFYQRYLRVFDELRLVCRCEESEITKNHVPLSEDARIEFVPVPIFHGLKEYAKVFFKVGKALQNITEECDAAVLRIPSTVAIRVGKRVMKSKIPYACEVVFDAEDAWSGLKGISRLAWKRIDVQMRDLCYSADGVSCVTEQYLQKHYFSKKQSAFTSNYSSLALPSSFYSNQRTSPVHEPLVVAHTANQIEYNGRKGHIEIVKAISILKQKGIDVYVKFAGKDYCGGVTRIKALANDLGVEDNVIFVGYLNREQLGSFLNNADIFVFPTRAEGLPRVIIEAMAKGLPCITTPVSGNPELIEDHFLVPYEDVISLAGRIEELCKDSVLYEQTSLNNYEKSKKYESSILEGRRDSFYAKLKDLVV